MKTTFKIETRTNKEGEETYRAICITHNNKKIFLSESYTQKRQAEKILQTKIQKYNELNEKVIAGTNILKKEYRRTKAEIMGSY